MRGASLIVVELELQVALTQTCTVLHWHAVHAITDSDCCGRQYVVVQCKLALMAKPYDTISTFEGSFLFPLCPNPTASCVCRSRLFKICELLNQKPRNSCQQPRRAACGHGESNALVIRTAASSACIDLVRLMSHSLPAHALEWLCRILGSAYLPPKWSWHQDAALCDSPGLTSHQSGHLSHPVHPPTNHGDVVGNPSARASMRRRRR